MIIDEIHKTKHPLYQIWNITRWKCLKHDIPIDNIFLDKNLGFLEFVLWSKTQGWLGEKVSLSFKNENDGFRKSNIELISSQRNNSFFEYIGKKFNRLTILDIKGTVRKNGNLLQKLICQCDCGRIKEFYPYLVLNGETKSCRCLSNEKLEERRKHEFSGDKYYRKTGKILSHMYRRCYEETDPAYKNYGARGITICDEWLNKETGHNCFHKWLLKNGFNGQLSKKEQSIDRIDNDGPYSPENCKLSTQTEQVRNRRVTLRFELNGETKTLIEWCGEYNIDYKLVHGRLKKGWSILSALETPKRIW